jgi:type I restriction enzyme S subunit
MKNNLPKGWQIAAVGDNKYTKLILGQSPESEFYNKEQKGLPFYQGKSDFGLKHPTPTVWCNKPKKIAEPYDILLCVRAPVGPTNIAIEKCCIGRGLAAIRCLKDLDYKYLIWVLKKFEKDIAKVGQGSTFDAIGKDEIIEIEFPFPLDKKEQLKIADSLSKKMASIEQMRQAALMQKAAVEALQGALLREVFPYKEGDELPKGWKWEKLDKIFEEVKNQVQPYEDEFKTLPFVGLENVVSHTREYTDEEYNPPASTCFKFDETNILYGKLRPYLNKVFLPTGKGKSSMELIPLKTKNNYSREFLAAVLQSEAVIGDTVKFSTGGRMPRADLKKLKKLEVAIPSDVSICNDLGISVSKKIKEFIDLNKKTLTQLEAIEALPAAILREVFEFKNN